MLCPKPLCGTEIRDHEASCPACGRAVDAPNVRAAAKTEEVAALARRLTDAETSASRRGCDALLAQFRDAVANQSVAVLSRDLSVVQRFVSSDNELYATFYQSVRGGSRRAGIGPIDMIRERVDVALFPYYHEHIRFASLSLDGRGLIGYGDCHVVLKSSAIEDRATVFEENSVFFCRARGLRITDPLPLGYRAIWRERERLAVAKLAERIDRATKMHDFPGILMRATPDRAGDEFIEVHIFGPLTLIRK